MPHHEKAPSDEKFVGNTQEGQSHIDWLHAKGVTSARLGAVAYSLNGKLIPESWGFRPVFIKFSDDMKYDRAMMRRTFGPHSAP